MQNSLKLKGNISICQIHELPLEYFCKTCEKWICTDCGVIDSEHKSHKILSKR